MAEQAKIEERRDLIADDQNFGSPRNLDVVQLAIIGYKATWNRQKGKMDSYFVGDVAFRPLSFSYISYCCP